MGHHTHLVLRPFLRRLIALVLVALLVAGACSTNGANDTNGPNGEPAATTTPPAAEEPPDPVAALPIVGGTDEDGDPLPPPVHAVFSVVVRGENSWYPYASKELTGLDAAATRALASRIRQIDQVLAAVEVPASFELAYGPAQALCHEDPDLLDTLEEHGHTLAIHAATNGESFRAMAALAECGRTATTMSGLVAMADPVGPRPTTVDTWVDSMAVLSIQRLDQVTGVLSPLCEELALAEHTNNYGTGAFTAPWRSGWTDGNPCVDKPDGEIVMVDQVPLAPREGERQVTEPSFATVASQFTQTLGWAADQRYKSASELPAPGMLTWGITVRLADLVVASPEPEDDNGDGDNGDNGGESTGTDGDGETDSSGETNGGTAPDGDGPALDEPEPFDLRTATLDPELLDQLATMLAEWAEAVEDERLIWLTPDQVGATLRAR